MSRKSHRKKADVPSKKWLVQAATIGGVLLLVVLVLVLKGQEQADDPAALAEPRAQAITALPEASIQATATLPEAVGQTQATAELAQATPLPNELPEAQLERLLTAGQPTLAFFHSNSCVQCIKMTGVVEQVYPEFADEVALVDVNVYDQRNASFLQRARIGAIPTQIFFDQTGQGTMIMGAMDPDRFREQMRALVVAADDCETESDSGMCTP